eukprot:3527029-Pleurochrysis_carterae.AAC.1
MGAVFGARSHDGLLVDGRSPRQLARQNGGDVTLWDFHPSLYGFVMNLISTTKLRVGTRTVCTRETEPLREAIERELVKYIVADSTVTMC